METTPALCIQQALGRCSLVNRADEAREGGQVGRAGQREEVPSRHLWPCTKGLHGETFYNCKCLTWTNRPLLPAPRPPAPTRPGTRASRERCGAGVGQGPCPAARQGSSPSAHQTPGAGAALHPRTRGFHALRRRGDGRGKGGRSSSAVAVVPSAPPCSQTGAHVNTCRSSERFQTSSSSPP